MKAPVYRTKEAEPCKDEIARLRVVCGELAASCSAAVEASRLLDDLRQAIDAVEAAAKATVPIRSGSVPIGYGLDKHRKAVACDTAIAILKQIKAEKGW